MGLLKRVLLSRALGLLSFSSLLFCPDFANAAELTSQSVPDNTRESIFPQGSVSLETSHFTWGVDIGASIDVTANEQSTFDADVVFGYKNPWIRLIGIGGGVHRSFGSGDNFLPLYFIFRSSFSAQPRLFFLNFKAGYSFNTIGNAATYGDTTASIGLGINLAMSRRFQSHIIIGYGFRHYSSRHQLNMELSSANVSLAQLSIGVNF